MNDITNTTTSYNVALVYRIGITAAFAGILFGIDVGVISGALKFVSQTFSLNIFQQGVVVSSLLVGAVLGTLITNPLSHHYGRKNALIISAIIFGVASFLSAIAPNYEFLVIVRVMLGVAVGIASFVTPVYLSEISPKEVRGSLISMYQLMVTIGILLAFISDTYFSSTENWRAMFGIILVPSTVLLIGALTLPASPPWLMMVGRTDEAQAVLRKIFKRQEEVDRETKALEENLSIAQEGWKVFKFRYFQKIISLGIMLQVIQIMTGMNTMMYFAPKIFELAGFDTHFEQMIGTISLGLLNIGTTVISLFIIDRWGRRPLSFFGLSFMTVGMFLLGLSFYHGPDTLFLKYMAVAGMLIFIFGFAISLGPVVWVMCAEIFPLKSRDIGVMFTTATNWACSALLGGLFLLVVEWKGPDFTFWLLGVVCILSFIFMYFYVPETKNVSLETIERNLIEGKKLRDIGAKIK